MTFEFGDIVLVPFPFTSQAASKRRPAVVVSSRTYNAAKLEQALVIRRLGALAAVEREALRQAIAQTLG